MCQSLIDQVQLNGGFFDMQLSLRSQLIAGTAAVVGASAIAMTPVTGAHVTLPSLVLPSNVQVALTSATYESPLSVLADSLGAAWADVVSTSTVTTPMFTGNKLQTAYTGFVGILPELVAGQQSSFPLLTQLTYNWSTYSSAIGDGVTGALGIAGDALWALPSVLLTATQQALQGDISGAVATLKDGILTPIEHIVFGVALPVVGVLSSGIVPALGAVLNQIPQIAFNLTNSVVGSLQALYGSVVSTVTNTVTALIGKDLPGAWNAAVDGLLGPKGIPGVLLNATIGQAQTSTNTPSLRTVLQSAQGQIARAIDGTALGSSKNYPVLLPVKSAAAVGSSSAAAAKAPAHSASAKAPGHAAAANSK